MLGDWTVSSWKDCSFGCGYNFVRFPTELILSRAPSLVHFFIVIRKCCSYSIQHSTTKEIFFVDFSHEYQISRLASVLLQKLPLMKPFIDVLTQKFVFLQLKTWTWMLLSLCGAYLSWLSGSIYVDLQQVTELSPLNVGKALSAKIQVEVGIVFYVMREDMLINNFSHCIFCRSDSTMLPWTTSCSSWCFKQQYPRPSYCNLLPSSLPVETLHK